MRVYVCYLNYGYEGKSEPLQVFADAKQASAWIEGTKQSHGTAGVFTPMEVIDGERAIDSPPQDSDPS